jgi:hypothetical protein
MMDYMTRAPIAKHRGIQPPASALSLVRRAITPGAYDHWEAVAERGADQALRGGPVKTPSVVSDGALPNELQESFESRLGFDFSRIRVHTSTAAARMTDAFEADAVTFGRHIYFAAGRYQPDTEKGQRLIAHELVHTVQQGEAPMHPVHRKSVGGRLGAELRTACAGEAPTTPMCRLRLTGSLAHRNRVLAIINRGLSLWYSAVMSSTGDITLRETGLQGPPTRETQAFTDRLKPIIDESSLTTIGVTAGGVPLVGSYALEQIDVADIERLGSGDRGWSAAAALLHELVEQRQKQQLGSSSPGGQFGTPTSGAHGTATAAELAVIGAVMESDSSAMAPNPNGTVSGTRTTIFRYPDGTRWEMVVTVVSNNVTNVARRRLP